MSGHRFQSLSFRTCIFFARNPDEWLTSADVADKYGVPSNTVSQTLQYSVESGLLRRETVANKSVYTAGPTLRELVGAG